MENKYKVGDIVSYGGYLFRIDDIIPKSDILTTDFYFLESIDSTDSLITNETTRFNKPPTAAGLLYNK